MNDLMNPSELSQFLLQHSISSLNSGIKSDPRDDDSVFGGVWRQPEEDTKKNALSLTGTEIWGPKPQLPSEKSGNSTSSSVKGTSSDVTPEIVPDKREKFVFGNFTANQGFSNNFPAYSHFASNMNSFGLISPSADIPLNQNLSNNAQQRKSEFLLTTEDKFKTSGSVWNNDNKPPLDRDLLLENLAQAMSSWNPKSALGSNIPNLSMMQKSTDVSSVDQLPEFCPSFSLQKEFEKSTPSYPTALPLPWNTVVKQSLPSNSDDNWMKLKSNADLLGTNAPVVPGPHLNKTNQNPQCFSPWDQNSKKFFPGVGDFWNANNLKAQSTSLQKLANQREMLLTNLNNSAAGITDLSRPAEFDPSKPPPPLPGQKTPLLNTSPDLQLLAASSSLPSEQLLNLIKSSNASIKPYLMNLTKSNLASPLKSHMAPTGMGAGSVSIPGFQSQCPVNTTYPWSSNQRISDVQLAVLYRKFARHLFPVQQISQTRSRMLQQLISLGFKREDAGKALMNNDLDFELALGELIFKTAIAKGLIDDPFKLNSAVPAGLNFPGQYPDANLLKNVPGVNKQDESLQNYLSSLELIIQKQKQQQLIAQNNSIFSSMQPQIDYTIQTLLNSQPNPPPSTYLPNLSFTNTNNNGHSYNNACFQRSLFDTAGTLAPSPSFLSSQQPSSSNLNPQCPEWVPSENSVDSGWFSSASSVSGGPAMEIAAIINNLKINSSASRNENSPLTVSQPWTSGKAMPESNKKTFSLTNPPSGLSSITIKEFIPGVPWRKDSSTSVPRTSEVTTISHQKSGGNFGTYFSMADNLDIRDQQRQDYSSIDSSRLWMPDLMMGSDGNPTEDTKEWMTTDKTGGYYNHNYDLAGDNDGGVPCEDGTTAYDTDRADDARGYEGPLDRQPSLFQSNWIVIKNIPETVSDDDMTDTLAGYGPIKSITFMKETNSALVCYATKRDAIEAKNGFEFSDSTRMFFDGATVDQMSAEFVPDWNSNSGIKGIDYDKMDSGKKGYLDDAAILGGKSNLSSPLADVGYTTPSGLWVPSKVLQKLEYCCTVEDDGEAVNEDGEDVDALLGVAEDGSFELKLEK